VTAIWHGANRVALLVRGEQYFPALCEAIAAARFEVFVETYLFADDASGRAVGQAMASAARRGVAVHCLVDGFGARDLAVSLSTELRDAGVRLCVYRPDLSPLAWFRRQRLRRMHRKLAVIDRRIGFVGGINLLNDTDHPHSDMARLDFAVRLDGPIIESLWIAAARLWNATAWTNLHRDWRVRLRPQPTSPPTGSVRVALVQRDNLRQRRDIEAAYLQAIAGANKEILLANAYFLPGLRFRRALRDAAKRGVRVRLLLQGRAEYLLVYLATRALYRQLLAAGVEISEYRRSFLHAKVAVIDRRWATVGSSNIDPLSLLLAREANALIEDPRFAAELSAELENAFARDAEPIQAERWATLSVWQRFANWTAYGLARLATGWAGYPGEL
jgi:cardiolipin synthase